MQMEQMLKTMETVLSTLPEKDIFDITYKCCGFRELAYNIADYGDDKDLEEFIVDIRDGFKEQGIAQYPWFMAQEGRYEAFMAYAEEKVRKDYGTRKKGL